MAVTLNLVGYIPPGVNVDAGEVRAAFTHPGYGDQVAAGSTPTVQSAAGTSPSS